MPWRVHSIMPYVSGGISEIGLHNLNDLRDYVVALADTADLKKKGVREGDHVLLQAEPFSGRKVKIYRVLVEERTGEEFDILSLHEV